MFLFSNRGTRKRNTIDETQKMLESQMRHVNLTHMQGEGACSRGAAAASWMWKCSGGLVFLSRPQLSVVQWSEMRQIGMCKKMISLFGSFCLFYVNCKISLLCRLELSTFNIAGNLKSVSGGECMPLKFVRNSLIRCIRFVATSAHVSPIFPN